jgi:hypothetical protein
MFGVAQNSKSGTWRHFLGDNEAELRCVALRMTARDVTSARNTQRGMKERVHLVEVRYERLTMKCDSTKSRQKDNYFSSNLAMEQIPRLSTLRGLLADSHID